MAIFITKSDSPPLLACKPAKPASASLQSLQASKPASMQSLQASSPAEELGGPSLLLSAIWPAAVQFGLLLPSTFIKDIFGRILPLSKKNKDISEVFFFSDGSHPIGSVRLFVFFSLFVFFGVFFFCDK